MNTENVPNDECYMSSRVPYQIFIIAITSSIIIIINKYYYIIKMYNYT